MEYKHHIYIFLFLNNDDLLITIINKLLLKYKKNSIFLPANNYSDNNDITGKFNLLRPPNSNFSINTNPCTTSPPAFSINLEAASNVPI